MQAIISITNDCDITAHDSKYSSFVTVEYDGVELQLLVRDFKAAMRLAAALEEAKPKSHFSICMEADVEAAEARF